MKKRAKKSSCFTALKLVLWGWILLISVGNVIAEAVSLSQTSATGNIGYLLIFLGFTFFALWRFVVHLHNNCSPEFKQMQEQAREQVRGQVRKQSYPIIVYLIISLFFAPFMFIHTLLKEFS